jgi:dTDP-4-dehydrorhamnose reductase
MRVLVAGGNGQLGTAITKEFSAAGEVLPMTADELDITDYPAVAAATGRLRPDVIVNCAAYNDVDGAEENPEEALRVNAIGVCWLARAARDCGAVLVHYSTDFVFSGEATEPYTEEDQPEPRSVYAASKLLGDWFALEEPRHYVLRVESLFGPPAEGGTHKSSVDRIIDGIEAGFEVRVFHDRVITPAYVADVACATRALLERKAPGGLYHCVNSNPTTWLELARHAELLMDCRARLVPTAIGEAGLRARRPTYSALSNRKLREAGIEMPSWQDALSRHLRSRQRC